MVERPIHDACTQIAHEGKSLLIGQKVGLFGEAPPSH
jgi:hypothetical protein